MKRAIIFLLILIVIIFTIIFIKNYYKKEILGNNMSNKSADEIKDYILNINSYEAEVLINVQSNKNVNTYRMKEKCNLNSNEYEREVLEPSNISGLKLNYKDNNLVIQNNKLGLEKLYQNYNYIENNSLSLGAFIQDFKNAETNKCYFEEEYCILETSIKNGNKYMFNKKLYINKVDGNPIRIEIEDVTQKTIIYILYNEIKINSL